MGRLETTDRPSSEEFGEIGFDLVEYLRILNKRKWLVGGIVAVFVALGALVTLMMTPNYQATVRLQIDRQAAKIVEGGNVTPLETGDGRGLPEDAV